MARPKKQLEEEVTRSTVGTDVVGETAETLSFPYKFKIESLGMTVEVVAEGVDGNGRQILYTADGCTFHK